MSELGIHTNPYFVDGDDIPVIWQSYDFSNDVSGLSDEHVRAVMLDSGVMYVPVADPKIRVSHLLDLDIQGLSALHEELCMERKTARCSVIEETVIDSISDSDLQIRFINTRLRMFGALCMMDGNNQEFAATHQLLEEIATRS